LPGTARTDSETLGIRRQGAREVGKNCRRWCVSEEFPALTHQRGGRCLTGLLAAHGHLARLGGFRLGQVDSQDAVLALRLEAGAVN
jgi:hypothetical protein